jgi:hypothetical protein
MTKQRGVKAVDRSKFREYQRVAQHFYDAAKDSIDLEYWTAAAVLIVHAAIAYADALCIVYFIQKYHVQIYHLFKNYEQRQIMNTPNL